MTRSSTWRQWPPSTTNTLRALFQGAGQRTARRSRQGAGRGPPSSALRSGGEHPAGWPACWACCRASCPVPAGTGACDRSRAPLCDAYELSCKQISASETFCSGIDRRAFDRDRARHRWFPGSLLALLALVSGVLAWAEGAYLDGDLDLAQFTGGYPRRARGFCPGCRRRSRSAGSGPGGTLDVRTVAIGDMVEHGASQVRGTVTHSPGLGKLLGKGYPSAEADVRGSST